MNAMYRNARFFRDAFANPTGPEARRLYMVGGLMMAVEILLWAFNKDDPRWEDLNDEQKVLHWTIIPNPMSREEWTALTPAQRLEEMGRVWKIPRQGPFAFFFGAVPRNIAEWLAGHDRAGFVRLLNDFEVVTGVDVIPTMLKPLVEVAVDKDTFRWRPINPRRQEDLPPEMRYGPYTSETAKAASEALADLPGVRAMRLTPNDVDHLIRGYVGHFGGTFTAGVDVVKRMIEGGPAQPAWKLQEYPVVRRFIARYPNVRSQPLEDFYEQYRVSREAMNGLMKLADAGRPSAEIQRWKREHQFEISMAGLLEAHAEQFSESRSQVDQILADTELDGAEKRDRIDVIVLKELDRARRVMAEVRQKREERSREPELVGR